MKKQSNELPDPPPPVVEPVLVAEPVANTNGNGNAKPLSFSDILNHATSGAEKIEPVAFEEITDDLSDKPRDPIDDAPADENKTVDPPPALNQDKEKKEKPGDPAPKVSNSKPLDKNAAEGFADDLISAVEMAGALPCSLITGEEIDRFDYNPKHKKMLVTSWARKMEGIEMKPIVGFLPLIILTLAAPGLQVKAVFDVKRLKKEKEEAQAKAALLQAQLDQLKKQTEENSKKNNSASLDEIPEVEELPVDEPELSFDVSNINKSELKRGNFDQDENGFYIKDEFNTRIQVSKRKERPSAPVQVLIAMQKTNNEIKNIIRSNLKK